MRKSTVIVMRKIRFKSLMKRRRMAFKKKKKIKKFIQIKM
jgi:hypothetical protein